MSLQNSKVSLPVIKRLPKYYRYLADMKKNGVVKVSSSELAHMMGTTASQVRQDFNCFGGFGQQGIGYHVDVLLEAVGHLLFSETKLDTILIGTGRLGTAISSYLTVEAKGYRLIGAFDKKAEVIGRDLCGVPVRNVRSWRASAKSITLWWPCCASRAKAPKKLARPPWFPWELRAFGISGPALTSR